MPLDFPNTPVVNDTYELNGKKWTFNGVGWQLTGTQPPPPAPTTFVFASKAAAQAATIDPTVLSITLTGFSAHNDAPIAIYNRVNSQPSHPGKLQSADGTWWAIQGPILWPEQFGAKGDGVTDDMLKIQDAETTRAALNAELRFKATNYYMSNPNSWVVLRPRWQGADHNSTVITMDGASVICIFLTGAGGLTSGYMRDILLWAPVTRTTGQALRLDGDATFQPDEFAGYNLKISGAGSWDIPLYVFGVDRAAPLGVRAVTFYNIFLGRDVTSAFYAETVVNLQFIGGGTFGGVTNKAWFAGSAGKESTDCALVGFKLNGLLTADRTTFCSFDIMGSDVTLGANSNKIKVSGTKSGVLSNTGTNNNTAALA